MESLISWLSATGLSTELQTVFWIIPAVQSVHILAICVVMASATMLNLRLLGVIGGDERMDSFTRRYLPWIFAATSILLLSGLIMIVAEPGRTLGNWTFWSKMALLATALTLTTALEAPILRSADFWSSSPRRHVARLLAVLTLTCWVGIVICGRWIAYTYDG